MTDDAPIPIETSDRATSPRLWLAPRVRRLIATSAETGITGSIDNSESLS